MKKVYLFLLILALASCAQSAIVAGTIPPGTIPPVQMRLMFIGNSLTYHPPYPERNWINPWGMAATQPDRDYVHRVQLGIAARQGIVPEIKIIRADIPWFDDGVGREIARYDPTLVIVQMGNNASTEPIEQWRTDYQMIAQAAEATGAYVVVVGLWDVPADDMREGYARLMAEEIGAPFIVIRDIYGPDTNGHADDKYTDPGVLWHPGDAGMALIAGRILARLYSQIVYIPLAVKP